MLAILAAKRRRVSTNIKRLRTATAVKMLRGTSDPRCECGLEIRFVGGDGESLGDDLTKWGAEVLGLTINEVYGQTGCDLAMS